MKWLRLVLNTYRLAVGMNDRQMLDPSILREYDIRGIVGDTLNPEDVALIGRAFGSVLIEQGGKTVAVGFDGRLSSPALEETLVDGLMSCGLMVHKVGLGPSPMLYFATHILNCDAGMMITGSHNPPDYNGIKMTLFGRAFFADDIQKLGDIVRDGCFASGDGINESHDMREAYCDRLLKDYHGQGKLTVAWDAGNGAAGEILEMMTAKMPGTHYLLNENIDGTFPAHHPDPTVEKNLDQLKQLVADKKCDLGIAFDGDGDRIGVIDNQGRVIWGDQLLVILARAVLKDEPGAAILCDVKASQVFFDEIKRLGGKPVMWKAGHSHIKTKMVELNSPLAGEMSAHIFFKHKYFGYDDALYAAIRLLDVLETGDETLEQIYDALPKLINTPEIRFDCSETRKFAVIDEVKARLKSSGAIFHDMDGVRVENSDGWWLLRASNTQAVLVARIEAATDDGLERLKTALAEQLLKSNIQPPTY